MRKIPRRAEVEIEGPFRTPEQLALAMPLVAMIGLMAVVSAVATGGSALVVALVALGGFGLCAIAPMALIDVYVTRPLRGALAQMRAARDGQAGEGAFASGVVADLVHLARDIHAAQASLGPYSDVYAQCERMIAAGDEAVRAFRLQSEDLAEVAAERDDRSTRAEIGELAEAVKALRAQPAASGLDGAVERLESMLVYIAESLERVEARERPVESGLNLVEQGIADLVRLVSRETQALQGALSGGGLSMRADIAGLAADDKIGRTRILERFDALEASLSAKLAQAPSPDAREIAEAEANRRALRDEVASGRLETVAADLSRAATEILQEVARRTTAEPSAALGDEMRALAATVAGLGETLLPGSIVEALRVELQTIVATVARFAEGREAPAIDLRADLHTVAGEIVEKIENVRARFDEAERVLAMREVPDVAGSTARALAEFDEAVGVRLRDLGDAQARRLDEIEGRVVDRIIATGRDNETATLTALTRASKQIAEAANWLDALGARPAFDAGDRPDGEAWERLGAEVRKVADAVEALSSLAAERLDAVARQVEAASAAVSDEARNIEPVREILGETEARLTGALADVAARIEAFEAQALAPASAALSGATQDFVAAQARIEAAAAKIEAGDPQLADATQRIEAVQGRLTEAAAQIEAGVLAAAPQEIQTRLAEFAQTLGAHSGALAALAPAQEALADATHRIEAAQSQLSQAVTRIEAGDPRLTGAVEAVEVFSQTLPVALAEMGEATRSFQAAQAKFDEEGIKALREDLAAMQTRFDQALAEAAMHMATLGVERLPEVAQDLRATEERWRELVGDFQTSAQKLAALTDIETRDIDALRADFTAAGTNVFAAVTTFAARFESEAEAQIDRLSQAVEAQNARTVAALAQSLRDLADAQSRREAALADDPRIAATQQALESLRADFAVAADAAAIRFDEAAQGLARSVEDRIETMRRGELSPAIAAAQATAQDLHTAHASLFTHIEALKAALGADRSSFAALRLDVVEAFAKVASLSERAEASMREAADRSQALATSVADLGAAERAELGAFSQTLAETGEHVAAAARAFAATHDAGLHALESRLAPPVASAISEVRDLARNLQDALALRGDSVVDAVAENSARLDALARLQDERLDGLEKLLSAGPGDAGVRSRALTPEAKPSGAVAKLVVSMADALDFRFSHIETALVDLSQRLLTPQARRDDDALDAGVVALATQLRSASDTLKSGLSDFVGVSAALAEEVARSGGAEASQASKAADYKH